MFVLPIIVFVLILTIQQQKKQNIVRSFADTWLLFTCCVWSTTELLSLFKLWNIWTVSFAWLVIIAALVWYGIKHHTLCFATEKISTFIRDKEYKKYCVFVIFGLIIFIPSLLRSTNNVDSMIYHLPRIMHWIQNGSVGHYATGCELQIRYPALSEYFVGQVLVLGGHDRLANLVQTFAYFGSGLLIYGIARRLNVSKNIALVIPFIYWFMPMAMAQTFSTQTDDIACLFLLVYLYFVLDFIQAEKLQFQNKNIFDAIRLASSVMFGYLCKPTICFTMVVFFVWMCIKRLMKKDSFSVLLKYVLVGCITVVIIYMPLMQKTIVTYKLNEEKTEAYIEGVEPEGMDMTPHAVKQANNTLAPDSSVVKTAIANPKLFAITCIKNLARNSTSICFPFWNQWLLSHQEAWEIEGQPYFDIQSERNLFYQDTASAPLIMFCSFLTLLMVLFRISKTNKEQTVFIICALLSLIIQCGLMGFSHFRTRYLVGVMAILCIAIGITIENIRLKKEYRMSIVLGVLSFGVIGAANTYHYEVKNTIDSFKGGDVHRYFLENYLPEEGHEKLVGYINSAGYTKVGIYDEFAYEYILWQKISDLERLECVMLQEEIYGVYEDFSFVPECIIKQQSIVEPMNADEIIICHGREYQFAWFCEGYGNNFIVYELMKEDSAKNTVAEN